MNEIQPIPTMYNGCLFRSRLEARWAVFFDVLGLKWEYEPEGFQLSNETWYLPDFWLPYFDEGVWCEVKPNWGGEEKWDKAIQFAKEAQVTVWLCEGIPEARNYSVVFGGFSDDDGEIRIDHQCVPLYSEAKKENRFFTCSGESNADVEFCVREYHPELYRAIQAARSAHFEFGHDTLDKWRLSARTWRPPVTGR